MVFLVTGDQSFVQSRLDELIRLKHNLFVALFVPTFFVSRDILLAELLVIRLSLLSGTCCWMIFWTVCEIESRVVRLKKNTLLFADKVPILDRFEHCLSYGFAYHERC